MKKNERKLKVTGEILSDPQKKGNKNLSDGKTNKKELFKSTLFIYNLKKGIRESGVSTKFTSKYLR